MSNQSEDDLARVANAVSELAEFFDVVQVFVSRYESTEGGTVHASKGCGNFYARTGHVREWLLKEEEAARVEIRKDNEGDE